ncbi:trem-like transcript 1 protein [Elephas maximus indicus]|uniref:trem-like transcript 1 protein n=1 Tax=Elephas maximus indicus TaxID=99487 RepID=UPI002115CF5E|nr:trem-like transcript 1 protein [Elephas maximus indicus]
MGHNLLLLLLLTPAGQGLVGSLPEVLQVPVGDSIQVHCHYGLQDVKARKVWCRFLLDSCQPLVSSPVDRRAPGDRRTFLTDLGGGLFQVEMISLREEDAGEYGCMVEGAAGSQTVYRMALEVIPPAPSLKEEKAEETYEIGSPFGELSSDPVGSASPLEPSPDEKSIPLIWGSVLLLALLVAAVVLFVVMAKRKGNRLAACGESQSNRVPAMDPSSVGHHNNDSGPADLPSDVPYVRLDSPPSFDNTTYTSLPLDPLSGKPPLSPPSPPLPPKAPISSKPVT